MYLNKPPQAVSRVQHGPKFQARVRPGPSRGSQTCQSHLPDHNTLNTNSTNKINKHTDAFLLHCWPFSLLHISDIYSKMRYRLAHVKSCYMNLWVTFQQLCEHICFKKLISSCCFSRLRRHCLAAFGKTARRNHFFETNVLAKLL